MKTVRLCETRYFGPTDHKGSRVQATHMTTRKRVTLPWDHALDGEENHVAAATKLFGREPEFRSALDGGGFIFGVDPANDEVA